MEEKIKGSDLAKAFVIPGMEAVKGKEIVKVLHDYNVSSKTHMSVLTEYELDVIFEYFTQKNQVADFSMYDKKKEEPIKIAPLFKNINLFTLHYSSYHI